MPPRSFVLAILVFWLGTSAWLFYREFVPRFRPDQPPRFFKFDFADEVRNAPMKWFVYRDKRAIGAPIIEMEDRVGSGTTQLRRISRSFRLISDFDFNNLELVNPKFFKIFGGHFEFKVRKLVGMYQVGLNEELQELAGLAKIEMNRGKGRESIIISQIGKVAGNVFNSKLQIKIMVEDLDKKEEDELFNLKFRVPELKGQDVLTIPLPSVPVASDASFLNPMHPLDKVPDLWEGQHWRMPLADPLGDALKSFGAKFVPLVDMRIQYLNADVTAQTMQRGDQQVDCLVIDYREPGEDRIVARTWVQKSDHLVLRQEAAYEGTRLVMERGLISK